MCAPDDREPVATVYAAAETADLDAIANVLAEDIVLYEPAHHPAVLANPSDEPGVWRGHDAVMEGVAQVFGALRVTGGDLHKLIADGSGTVVGLLDLEGPDIDGEPYAMPMSEVFQVADGKVT